MAYKELYIADSIEALNLIADPAAKVGNIPPKSYVEVLKSLYRQTLGEPFDQEKLYILLFRYIHVYEAYLLKEQDTKFVNLRFGLEYKKVLLNFLETRRILIRRYATRKEAMLKQEQEKEATVKPSNNQPEETNKGNMAMKKIFNSDYITCAQLYSALDKNILLVDARSESDFKESRIEHRNCINIPENCIKKGLSANALGHLLPTETKKIWDKRDEYDVIVIYDWGSNFDNFGTKLLDLRSAIVEWDPNRNYKEKPVILKGGYLELLETYPSICSNPQVILSNRNNELDELIYLDYITYPSESDSKTSIMGEMNFDEIVNEVTNTVQRGDLYEEFKNLSKDRDELIDKMIDTKNSLRNFKESINNEMDYNKIRRLKNQEKKLKDEVDEMKKDLSNKTEKINQIKQEFDLCLKYGSRTERGRNEQIVKEIVQNDVANQKKMKILETMEDEFTRALQKARASKPKYTDNKTNEMTDPQTKHGNSVEKPTVDRGTKPKLRVTAPPFVPLSSNSLGKVGLVNIKNTCYMNAGLQCFRNLPQIKALFCNDIYKNKYLLRQPPAIINELANLVRCLWTTASKSIEPTEFYRKICILEPGYSGGAHEDSMEFFLFLLNHLIEDCFYYMKQTNILTPKQKAWYNQFQGRCSVFAELFYHQIKIKQFCDGCNRHSIRFDIESTFMVPVPDGDFNIQELLNQYMDDYVIKEFCCSACKKPVKNQKTLSYAPSILIIILKRYRQVLEGDTLSLYKSNCKGDFPINDLVIDNHRYELNSFIMHVGNLNYGHYTAACNIKNDGWYEFDDHMVKALDVNDDSVKSKACVYFYTLCD